MIDSSFISLYFIHIYFLLYKHLITLIFRFVKEELAILRRKAERMKKMEQAGSSMDEVLLEEIREYKETLTCPSCKVTLATRRSAITITFIITEGKTLLYLPH